MHSPGSKRTEEPVRFTEYRGARISGHSSRHGSSQAICTPAQEMHSTQVLEMPVQMKCPRRTSPNNERMPTLIVETTTASICAYA